MFRNAARHPSCRAAGVCRGACMSCRNRRIKRKWIALSAGLIGLPIHQAMAATDITSQITANGGVNDIPLTGGSYTVTLSSGDTVYSGIISGTGTVTVQGAGTLQLENTNTYTLSSVGESIGGFYQSNNDPAYYNYEGYTSSGFIGWVYALNYGSTGQPDPPAATIDSGDELILGYNSDLKYGNDDGTEAVGNISNSQTGGINIDNILDNGLLTVQCNNSEPISTGLISGSGNLLLQTGLLYLYGSNPLTGTVLCDNNMTLYVGTDHMTGSIPDAKVVFNNGSFIVNTPFNSSTTFTQNVYENHYGNDINIDGNGGLIVLSGVYSYSDAGTSLAQEISPSLSNYSENYEELNGSANRRGINLEGGVLQLGNGASTNFFMPGNNFTEYFNLHGGAVLGIDYASTGPTYDDITIAGGGIQTSFTSPGIGTVVFHQGDIVITVQQYYDGITQIDSGATVQLGDGTTGDTVYNHSNNDFVSQTSDGDGDIMQAGQTVTMNSFVNFAAGSSTSVGSNTCQIIDNGSLVVDNVNSTLLSNLSGRGSLTQAGADTTTLGPSISYTGATLIAGGALLLETGASLASSSGVTISSANRSSLIASPYSSSNTNFVAVGSPILDISQAGNQTIQNLSGDATGTIDLGGNTLTVNSVNSTTFGGNIFGSSVGGSLFKTGAATLTLSGTNTYGGSTDVETGDLVVASPDSLPASTTVVIGSGATLDVASNTVFLVYGSSPDPIFSIESYLTSGYMGGAWNGPGIVSSSVAAANKSQSSLIYSVGYADGADGIELAMPSDEIEIRPTLAGDARLDGDVNFGDFQILTEYFGQPGTWDEGNFTYGSIVDFGDFQLLSQNFGVASSLTAGQWASMDSFADQFGQQLVADPDGVGFSAVPVPEPLTTNLLGIGAMALITRRKRRREGFHR